MLRASLIPRSRLIRPETDSTVRCSRIQRVGVEIAKHGHDHRNAFAVAGGGWAFRVVYGQSTGRLTAAIETHNGRADRALEGSSLLLLHVFPFRFPACCGPYSWSGPRTRKPQPHRLRSPTLPARCSGDRRGPPVSVNAFLPKGESGLYALSEGFIWHQEQDPAGALERTIRSIADVEDLVLDGVAGPEL